MSEQLAGNAGIIQGALETEVFQNQAHAESLGLLDRLRNKWMSACAAAAIAIGAMAGSVVESEPAYAANTETATIGMPFEGKWAYPTTVNPPYTDQNSSHPSVHARNSADWATDVYAPPGTEARLKIGNVSGNATYTTSNVEDTSCGAGKRVRVNVKVDNVDVGWVQYEHLDTELTNGIGLVPGSLLGKTKRWTDSQGKPPSCYAVSNDAGVHLHVGMKNIQDNHSCYTDHGKPGENILTAGTDLGLLGSTNSGVKEKCSESGGGTTPGWPAPNLYEIQNWNSPSGLTEIKELPAANSYQQWGNGYVTNDGWHGGEDVDYAMADYNGDNVQDVIGIQHNNTASGMTEIRVFNGSGSFQAGNRLVTPDGLHGGNDVDYVALDYGRNGGPPDIARIMHWNTGSGKTEVRILDGNTNYSTWLTPTFVTPDGWHGGDDVDYAASVCGTTNHPNIYVVQHQNTPSGMTEVKRLDGNGSYTSWNGGWSTADGQHSGNDANYTAGDCNENTGLPDVFLIQHQNTNNGNTHVKRLNGGIAGAPFSQWEGGWVTPDGWHSSHDVDFVMAQKNN